MSELYLWIFAALALGGVARGLWQPARMYEYPYFMAATFAIFLLPQAISLLLNPGVAVGGVDQNSANGKFMYRYGVLVWIFSDDQRHSEEHDADN